MSITELTLFVGLLSAFTMLLLNKWNFFEWVAFKLQITPCLFCFSFWFSVIWAFVVVFSVPGFALPNDVSNLTYLFPFASTAIAWFIALK
jgi:hypothetical protein